MSIKIIQKNKLNTKQGITLLIAVSVASIVLILVLNILNIAIKEIQISGFLRESQKSFYAADAGIECALYWDVFNSKLIFPEPGQVQVKKRIDCIEENIKTSVDEDTITRVVTSFALKFSNNNDDTSCAYVTVTKEAGLVTIESRGVNKNDASVEANCNAAPGQTQRLERALKATYTY